MRIDIGQKSFPDNLKIYILFLFCVFSYINIYRELLTCNPPSSKVKISEHASEAGNPEIEHALPFLASNLLKVHYS